VVGLNAVGTEGDEFFELSNLMGKPFKAFRELQGDG